MFIFYYYLLLIHDLLPIYHEFHHHFFFLIQGNRLRVEDYYIQKNLKFTMDTTNLNRLIIRERSNQLQTFSRAQFLVANNYYNYKFDYCIILYH